MEGKNLATELEIPESASPTEIDQLLRRNPSNFYHYASLAEDARELWNALDLEFKYWYAGVFKQTKATLLAGCKTATERVQIGIGVVDLEIQSRDDWKKKQDEVITAEANYRKLHVAQLAFDKQGDRLASINSNNRKMWELAPREEG
jgi:hypothetical protein